MNTRKFDPNAAGLKGTLFGLPHTTDSAEIVVIPVPWDVTVSYGAGTAEAPSAILEASSQIDSEFPDQSGAWKTRVAMAEIPEVWQSLSKSLRPKAQAYINWLTSGKNEHQQMAMDSDLHEVNRQCKRLMSYVREQTAYWQSKGKKTILLGGDHSTSLGHIQVCAEKEGSMGILQIDAHADLRKAYEGFTHSHASIMYNALQSSEINKLVQVGVRDYCEEEFTRIAHSNGRIHTFFDQHLKEAAYTGKTWHKQCLEIVATLPDKVYISFDIDGLDSKLCPNTGTPVPGGLEMGEVCYLLKMVVASGRKFVGADLNEVVPGVDEWDANVGARVLWFLANLF